MTRDDSPPPGIAAGRDFRTTHWSLVMAARHAPTALSQQALEQLCRTYWFPVYAFVRRRGHPPEDAQDLTQGFFARVLATETLLQANGRPRISWSGSGPRRKRRLHWSTRTSFRSTRSGSGAGSITSR